MKKTFARMEVKADKGLSALSHAKYIMGLGGYRHKQDEIQYVAMGNMPDWAIADPLKFWRASDENERSNGNKYREHVINLPRELTPEQRQEVIEAWIEQELGDRHAYTYAIHVPNATDGKAQPHCHLMFCDRKLDDIQRTEKQFFKRYNSKSPERGGAKKLNTGMSYSQRQTQIKQIRQDWGDLLNAHLLKNGFEPDVDMRNWQERGLDAPPINLSLAQIKLQKRLNGLLNDRVLPKYHLPQKNALETITERNRASKDDGLDQEKQKQADLTPKPKPPAPKPF